ncbi:hypothetical protein RSAG8_02269, partial [Rhizoctonia solani AG-8 WAC10335]
MSISMLRSAGYTSALAPESLPALYAPSGDLLHELDAVCLQTRAIHRLEPPPSPSLISPAAELRLGIKPEFDMYLPVPQRHFSNGDSGFAFPDPSAPPATPVVPPLTNQNEEDEEIRRLVPFTMASENILARLESLRVRRDRDAATRKAGFGLPTVNRMRAPRIQRNGTTGLHYSNHYSSSSRMSTPPIATPRDILRSESNAKRGWIL